MSQILKKKVGKFQLRSIIEDLNGFEKRGGEKFLRVESGVGKAFGFLWVALILTPTLRESVNSTLHPPNSTLTSGSG
ncbi:MAG: hypothetical protein K6C40_09860, partial [Thermoguttaceae bacterium]|nr:hypothetical protein [Thermoguttaceae bacterium]